MKPLAYVAASIGLVISFTAVALLQRPRPFLTAELHQQIPFTVLAPTGKSLTADRPSIHYAESSGTLTFVSHLAFSDDKLSMTEQAFASDMAASPALFAKLVEQLNQYDTIDTALGRVYLTHPAGLNGGQTAIINTMGTLTFIRSDSQLTQATWARVVAQLEAIR